MRTAPSKETEIAQDDVADYLAIIQEWRELLQDAAATALTVNGIGELESQNLERALNSLDSIGKLVRLVLDPHVRTLGLVDERDSPTWLTNGAPDFNKMMSVAAAKANRLTAQARRDVAYGLASVWAIITSVYIVGSHGSKNAIDLKLRKDSAAYARDAKRSDEIDEVVHRHRDVLWNKKPSSCRSKLGTAKQIREGVIADLAKLGIDSLTVDAIRKRL
jgi:hypothetical protein